MAPSASRVTRCEVTKATPDEKIQQEHPRAVPGRSSPAAGEAFMRVRRPGFSPFDFVHRTVEGGACRTYCTIVATTIRIRMRQQHRAITPATPAQNSGPGI